MVQKKKKTSVKSTPDTPVVEKAEQPVSEKENTTTQKCSLGCCKHPFARAAVLGLLIAFVFISIDFLPRAYYQLFPTKPTVVNPVVARVNNHEIRLQDVAQLAQSVPELSGVPFDVVYPRLLDSMINMRVIANAAEASGIEQNENVQKVLKNTREQILSQAFLADRLEKLMTEEKLRALYLQEIAKFKNQDEIKARHILLKTKAEADKIRQQLKSGSDFKKLVAEHSLAKEKDGDLGYFTQNMMIPEFATVVFKMKEGEISEPIQTPMGWHVVVVDDKRPVKAPLYENVKEELKQLFAAQNLQNVLSEERQKQKVDIIKPTF